ncbi:protease [Caulobacter phage Jess A]|nr:protease [Caulobacter phage Jess A]QNH91701.1 endopeptidase [Caulobacter phage SR18]WCA46458.1 protease [Caulobacter phage RapA]WCD56233.1 protease [Caulobacter phage BL94]
MTTMPEHDPYEREDHTTQAKAEVEKAFRYKIADLKWLMQQKRGRRVVWRLLEDAGVYRLSYAPDAPNVPMATAFAEGQRNMGLMLTALLMEHCSEDYARMIQDKADGN